MKKGDTVRFVHTTGGGVISGFREGNIVLVEDEDGFEIPTLMSDVVVIESNNDKLLKGNSPQPQQRATAIVPEIPTVKREYSAGNRLTVHLAFIPKDINYLGHTDYDAYVVNDSNYCVFVTIAVAEDRNWKLRHALELEPNSKEHITTMSIQDVAKCERICVQLVAFKRDRSYEMKPSVDVQMRLDQVKFCKGGSFVKTEFFEEPAMLTTIIEADKSARPLVVQTDAMKKEMYKDELPTFTESHKRPAKPADPNAPLVIDLHADALLDNFQGLSSADILQYQLDQFHKVMHEHRKEKGKKIVFIHGKGEGRLRNCVIQQLQYRYKPCTYQDASFREYGYGATQVTIK